LTRTLLKVRALLKNKKIATPFLALDLSMVEKNYQKLIANFPTAGIFYAVKACPIDAVIKTLVQLGSSFDIASKYELDQCLKLGAKAENISYGNTIKKEADIAYAYKKGVRLFAFDSTEELSKIARVAPGSQVFCRILANNDGAEWPLSLKFGCYVGMAEKLLLAAEKKYKLNPIGLSFHVGSQQNNISAWNDAIAKCAFIFQNLAKEGIHLSLLNLGGGFPAHYLKSVASIRSYAAGIRRYLKDSFRENIPRIILEPGRSLVGDAGIIVSEVILTSRKSPDDEKRWVYLDIGKFGGLAETMNESICYPITSERRGPSGPVVLAGPTCDSADVLYQDTLYKLPLSLRAGDLVYIHTTGAYTASYSAVAFNGFPPLMTKILPNSPSQIPPDRPAGHF
jgi:ornithine decarboxylase